MRDHADNYARTHFETRERRLPQRAPGPVPGDEVAPASPAAGGGMPVNERAYRRVGDAIQFFRPLSQGAPAAARDEDEPGYVIHLPIRVSDLAAATRLAYVVAGSLAFLHELDPGETTVSTADDQNNRHRVFCDLLLPDRSRCPQQFEHAGACGPQPDGEFEEGALPRVGTENGGVPRQWDRP